MSVGAETLTELFAAETLGEPENAINFVIWRVVQRYVREIDRALVPVGLTHLQFTALALLAWMGQ